jgi:hypothetical protein
MFLFIIVCSLSVGAVIAEPTQEPEPDESSLPKITPEQIRAVESINSPEKMAAWLRNKHQVSLSQQWPSNFPVPVYPSNVINKNFSSSTKGQPMAGASLTTKDQPRQVFEFYQSAFSRAGWKLQAPSAKARNELKLDDNTYFLNGTLGKQSISLRSLKDPQSGGTMLSISWRKN